ncbi:MULTISPECIES: protein phosphatase 2C domain-containing protein [Streptomycetaceae]|uniref:Putative FHA domain containing protein n=1 Tax=Streptantibioticus cattleyicolor (strain ATCC 35852 / DSM 46488 / JCM 4925 / NBRC 14057 / NRRL 8057) TaxID=1003195 RepID=F8JXL3_STREN|nr:MULTISPECIES: protein phosphatase 2C domain-containing protein [Streptomycetaceae]AEW97115.1 putative FHA domain containing protein [Streptantibioticus cattleyicolor NRRL 8057 = DSM 46488]MYS61574.1 hypothetical protein [Streptomyces sp. SID5468]CCB77439.1 conserved protein of unknown function [Streptantibioticus cattleyicolor NRRL 8057 = DSM 46488]
MSHQGEAHRHEEDMWWQRLYDDTSAQTAGEARGDPGRAGPLRSQPSLDEHFAAALRVASGAVDVPALPPPRAHPAPAEPTPPPDTPDHPVPSAGSPSAASYGEAASALPARPEDGAGEAEGATAACVGPLGGVMAGGLRPGEPDVGVGGAPEGGSWAEALAEAEESEDEGGGALPSLWRGAWGQEDRPEAVHIGDRPPTYEAEPTAWPQADPDALAEPVPDTVLDGARYGVLTVRAACVRGDSARFRGRARGETLLTARFGAGESALLFMAIAGSGRAVADGHRAAAAACRAVAGAVGRSHLRLVDDIRSGRTGALSAGLCRLAERGCGELRGGPGADGHLRPEAGLSCLLLPVDPECRLRIFFGAGTGGLFRLRDGEWCDLDPDLGISPQPVPRTGDGARTAVPFRFRAVTGRAADTLLLCSAGLADPLREEPALARRLADRWGPYQSPPGLAGFLADTQTRVKGYADDRTAVAVWEA